MEWWIWMTAGLLLLAVELLTPGSLFWIFFAGGAMAAGLAVALSPGLPLAAQGAIFGALSLITLAVFRKPLLARMNQPLPAAAVDSLVGEVATAVNEIGPGEVGQAELRGTAWSATNATSDPIAARQRCRVDRVDGLMLFLRAESESR